MKPPEVRFTGKPCGQPESGNTQGEFTGPCGSPTATATGGKPGTGLRVDQTRASSGCFRKVHIPPTSCRGWLGKPPFVSPPVGENWIRSEMLECPTLNTGLFGELILFHSFVTDSAEQQGTDLLRGLAAGLRLCHSRFAALSSLLSSHVFPSPPPPPPPAVFWQQSLFGWAGPPGGSGQSASRCSFSFITVSSRSGS